MSGLCMFGAAHHWKVAFPGKSAFSGLRVLQRIGRGRSSVDPTSSKRDEEVR
jgi:hypothetical protein